MQSPRDRLCWTCRHYGFKRGNPAGWRWACCEKKQFWFSDTEDRPGDRKGCEDWE